MLRHSILSAATGCSMLVLASCATSQGPDPMTPAPGSMIPGQLHSPQAQLGGIAAHEGSLEGAMSLARMTIDPSSLTASIESADPRSAQQTDDQYELDTTIYFQPADIRIIGVAGTATTIDVSYAISHPFAAPTNLLGPASATNRADLGITGRVLFLIDTPTIIGSTYFSGTDNVQVNTSLVTNAAGYYKPNGLLDTTGLIANTFPYQPLVDEFLYARTVTATGAVLPSGTNTGNYSIPAGWKESNMSPSNAGWRGYGWLHQGQTIPGMVSLSRADITGPVSFDVAIIAKYTDPRSGTTSAQKRANRLPIAPSSNRNLFYRAPHGALDLERVEFLDEGGGFLSNTISASELRFYITDWDARATETTLPDLNADTVEGHVPIGASGPPALSVCIPGVLGDATTVATVPPSALTDDDTAYGGGVGPDSGEPTEPLFYRALITKGVGSGQVAGSYTGLVRVEDPEANLNRGSWYFPLNGSVIPPIPLSGSATLPEPVVYQAFDVDMAAPFPPSYIATWGGSSASTNVSSMLIEPGGGSISVGYFTGTVDFDPGAPVVNRVGGVGFNSHGFVLALDEGGAFRWVATYGGPGVSTTGTQVMIDSTGNIHIAGAYNGTVDFDPGAGVQNRTSAGSIDAFVLELAQDGSYVTVLTWGSTNIDFASDIDIDSSDRQVISGNFQATVDFDPGPGVVTRTVQGSQDTFVLMLNGADTFQWVDQFGGGAMSTYCTAVAFDSLSQPVACGAFYGTSDFLPGVGTNNKTSAGGSDCWAASFDTGGLLRWIDTWGSTGNDACAAVEIDDFDATRILGNFIGTVDFDPNAGTQPRSSVALTDSFCLSLNTIGGYQWIATWGGPGNDYPSAIVHNSTSAPWITGTFSGTVDFDPGASTVNLVSNGGDDAYFLALTSAGAYANAGRVGGSANDTGWGIGIDNANRPRLVGTFIGTADFDPGAGTVNRTAQGTTDSFFLGLKADGTF